MNAVGNYDNGFNARFYVSFTVKSSSNTYEDKYCFAWVYFKFNSDSDPQTGTFRSGIISSDNDDTWTLEYGESTQGTFWLRIIITSGNDYITEIHTHIS